MSTLVPLTFSEICPKWDKLLDNIEQTTTAKMDKEVLKDLGNWSKCVVGEAYHHSQSYIIDCHKCYAFAVKFATEGSDREKYDKQFVTMKNEFAEHFNKEHLYK